MKKRILFCFVIFTISIIFTSACFADRIPDLPSGGLEKAMEEGCECPVNPDYDNGKGMDIGVVSCQTDCACKAQSEWLDALEKVQTSVFPGADGSCPSTYTDSRGNVWDIKTDLHWKPDYCVKKEFPYRECKDTENPPDKGEAAASIENALRSQGVGALGSDCPCPGGVTVTSDEDGINFLCNIGGDQDASVRIIAPYPVVKGANPQYPLVGMLAGVYVEWEGDAFVDYGVPGQLTWGAPNGTSEEGGYYGAQVLDGVFYDITVSSIYTGLTFNEGYADALSRKKNPLDRTNIEFAMPVNVDGVDVLSTKDIYMAYKNNSKYVQAYTVFAGRGFGERPWTTYEKFIDAMCEMSSYEKSKCVKAISWDTHRDLGREGFLYLGNGDPLLIGLYSEVSSHGCHGATTVNDQGDPAFGIKITSTWCFYVHAEWAGASFWNLDDVVNRGSCCLKAENVTIQRTGYQRSIPGGSISCSPSEPGCKAVTYNEVVKHCTDWRHYYSVFESWNSMGGGSSSGDCGICQTSTKFWAYDYSLLDSAKDEMYGVAFYQSQPLIKQKPTK